MPAHHAEHQRRPPAFIDQAGNDGVQRALARSDAIRMPLLYDKALATIVEHHARFRLKQASSIGMEERVDEAYDIPILVHRADIDGVAVLRPREDRHVCDRSAKIYATCEL